MLTNTNSTKLTTACQTQAYIARMEAELSAHLAFLAFIAEESATEQPSVTEPSEAYEGSKA